VYGYDIVNGQGPFTTTLGTINDRGLYVDTAGKCGMVTITVTDACNKKASVTIKMPLGVWVLVYDWQDPRLGAANTACQSVNESTTEDGGTKEILALSSVEITRNIYTNYTCIDSFGICETNANDITGSYPDPNYTSYYIYTNTVHSRIGGSCSQPCSTFPLTTVTLDHWSAVCRLRRYEWRCA
jgi:hypothetical protein